MAENNGVDYRDDTPLSQADIDDVNKLVEKDEYSTAGKKIANWLKTKLYGKPTRGAMSLWATIIGDSTQKNHQIAKDSATKVDNIGQRFDDQIAGSTNDDEEIDFRHSDMLQSSFKTMRKRGDFWDDELKMRGVSPYWFGAIADFNEHILKDSYASLAEAQKDYPCATSLDDEKDWCALTAAVQLAEENGYNLFLGQGNYVVNKTVTLPQGVQFCGVYQHSRIQADQAMCQESLTVENGLAILEYDKVGQPPLYIDNIQILAADEDNNLVGLHIGGNRASKFNNLVVTSCKKNGVLCYSSDEESADIENVTFEHYWQVNSGPFEFNVNPKIPGGNITDFAIYDSQITSATSSNKSDPAIKLVNQGDLTKSLYGVSISRTFIQTINNNLVYIVGNGAGTHDIVLDFLKGEIWHDNSDNHLGGVSDQYIFHFENAKNIIIKNSRQLGYIGASFAELLNVNNADLDVHLNDPYLGKATAAKLDKYTRNCAINLSGFQIVEGSDPDLNIFAKDEVDLYQRFGEDNGYNNRFNMVGMSNSLILGNKPSMLNSLTDQHKINGMMDVDQAGVLTYPIIGTPRHQFVFSKNVKKERLMLPAVRKMRSGFYFKAKITGDPADVQKLYLQCGDIGIDFKTDGAWHTYTVIADAHTVQAVGITLHNENTPLSNDVTFDVEAIEMYQTPEIPFAPDYATVEAD